MPSGFFREDIIWSQRTSARVMYGALSNLGAAAKCSEKQSILCGLGVLVVRI